MNSNIYAPASAGAFLCGLPQGAGSEIRFAMAITRPLPSLTGEIFSVCIPLNTCHLVVWLFESGNSAFTITGIIGVTILKADAIGD